MSGKYVWKYENLYDRNWSGFNSFETPKLKWGFVIFQEESSAENIKVKPAFIKIKDKNGDIFISPRKQKGKSSERTGTLFLDVIPWAYENRVDIENKGIILRDFEIPIVGFSLVPGKHNIHIYNNNLNLEKNITVLIKEGETTKEIVNLK